MRFLIYALQDDEVDTNVLYSKRLQVGFPELKNIEAALHPDQWKGHDKLNIASFTLLEDVVLSFTYDEVQADPRLQKIFADNHYVSFVFKGYDEIDPFLIWFMDKGELNKKLDMQRFTEHIISQLCNPEPQQIGYIPTQIQVGGAHYKDTVNPIEFYMSIGPQFALFNASKYVIRYKQKNGIQDLQKVLHYIDFIEWYFRDKNFPVIMNEWDNWLTKTGRGDMLSESCLDFHSALYHGNLRRAREIVNGLIAELGAEG